MITLLYGENDYAKRQKLQELCGENGTLRHDGEELSIEQLREILQAQTLFTTNQKSVIVGLSESVDAWSALPELADNYTGELILVETKLDKRTKAYKWLSRHARILEHANYTEKQRSQLVSWCLERADALDVVLTRNRVEWLIDRLGYDQGRLQAVFEQLSLAGEVSDELLAALVPLPKSESAFELFEAALQGNGAKVHSVVAYLEATSGDDGAYMTMGLLASQASTLAGLVLSGGDQSTVTSQLKVHPFVVSKLATYARRLDKQQLQKIVHSLFTADLNMKTANVPAWMLVESALIEISSLNESA